MVDQINRLRVENINGFKVHEVRDHVHDVHIERGGFTLNRTTVREVA